MYKTLLETLDRAGVHLPTWFFIVVAILIVITILLVVFKKYAIPAIFKIADIYTDICSIKELKNVQMKAINKSIETDTKIENELFAFMEEMRNIISDMQNNINQHTENRCKDREVSIEREQRINDRIDNMLRADEYRDKTIDVINGNLKKLTDMFVDKQINDYRWEIINFAINVSEKNKCTKDGFKHCFATYERYEKILEENDLENGEVEISMDIINEAYKEKMLEGF